MDELKEKEGEKNNQQIGKELTLDELKNIDKKFDKKKSVTITSNDGQDFNIQVDEIFKESQITDMVTELINKIIICKNKNGNIYDFFYDSFWILLIRYFTDFGRNYIGNLIDEQYITLKYLIDTDLFSQIISNFNEDEVLKVINKINAVSENSEEIFSMLPDEVANIDLENEDVLQTNEWIKNIKSNRNNV